MSSLPRSRSVSGIVTALSAAAFALSPAAAAGPVPFTDPNVSGYIGFCDASGHQIRSGSIDAVPFVVRAVSSVPAPAGMTKATLYLYQPRKDHDPGEWTGKQMTAASSFTSMHSPMAVGTPLDASFVNFSAVQPLLWDSLAQARMYFSAPGYPIHTSPYPAAVIRLTGNTWTQVGGGNVACNAGTAQSAEESELSPSILAKARARAHSQTSARTGSPSSGAVASGSHAAVSASSPSGANNPSVGAGAPSVHASPAGNTASAASSGSGAGLWVTLGLIGAALAAGAAYLARRRFGRGLS